MFFWNNKNHNSPTISGGGGGGWVWLMATVAPTDTAVVITALAGVALVAVIFLTASR